MALPLTSIREKVLDFFFPPFCVSCHQNGSWLCEECLKKRKPESSWRCLVCEKEKDPHAICPACRQKQALKGIFITGRFDEVMQRAIHSFKYQYSSVFAKPLAEILDAHLKADPAFQSFELSSTVLVPVPLHRSKQHLRGYNQSELLSRALLPCFPDLTMAKALRRNRATASQMELDRQDRLVNVRDAFALDKTVQLKDKTIILVDDVCTTGSTLFECAKALVPAKPKEIWAAVLGHG